MSASIKGTCVSIKSETQPKYAAQPGWFSAAAAAAKNKENLRVAKHVGIGAALGTAGVLLYQHFAG